MSGKEKPEIKEYNEDMQRLLLQFMISDSGNFVRSQNIINPSYWNDTLRSSCRYIKEYSDEYKVLPTPEQIQAETGTEIQQLGNDVVVKHSDWYLNTIEEFCRHKAMEALVYDGPTLVREGRYAELERRSKENMMITLQKDIGTNYFLDPAERLRRMKDRTGMTSTGWKDIDAKLYGGMNRGELTFFAGGPGCVSGDTKIRVIELLDI
jgi:hypothetical protein